MWTAYKADDKEAYKQAAEDAGFEIPDEVKLWIEGPKTELEKLKGVKDTPEEETVEEPAPEPAKEATGEISQTYT